MSGEGSLKTFGMFPSLKFVSIPLVTLLIGIGIGIAMAAAFRLNVGLPVGERIHRLLENAYLCSGILIAALAAVGLRQLQLTREGIELTRELAEENQSREASRLAIEQCTYFAEKIIPLANLFVGKVKSGELKSSCALLQSNLLYPPFTIDNNDIQIPGFQFEIAYREMLEIQALTLMNLFEGFAIVFASNMANEEIGYLETGITFLEWMQYMMPCFKAQREARRGPYMSAITLYTRWQKRYISENLPAT